MARKAEFMVKPASKGYELVTDGRRLDASGNLGALYRQADEIWVSFAKALGVYGKHTKATFLAMHPVPYTKDSLLPPRLGRGVVEKSRTPLVNSKTRVKVKVPPGFMEQVHATSKKIREKAVQKIVDDAKNVGIGKIPKTAPGRAYTRTPASHPEAVKAVKAADKAMPGSFGMLKAKPYVSPTMKKKMAKRARETVSA